MYDIIAKKKVRKKIESYINQRSDIPEKLRRLQADPKVACGAHPLKGELKGKWACWLGLNIRMVYTIDDENKLIVAHSIGTHKVY